MPRFRPLLLHVGVFRGLVFRILLLSLRLLRRSSRIWGWMLRVLMLQLKSLMQMQPSSLSATAFVYRLLYFSICKVAFEKNKEFDDSEMQETFQAMWQVKQEAPEPPAAQHDPPSEDEAPPPKPLHAARPVATPCRAPTTALVKSEAPAKKEFTRQDIGAQARYSSVNKIKLTYITLYPEP